MTTRIGSYHPGNLPVGSFMSLFIACTGAGKSVALRHILGYNHDKYDVAIMCCNSPAALLDFQKMTLPALVYDHWPEDVLWRLMNVNERRKLDGKKQLRFLLVMDDLIHDKKCMKSKLLAKLATAGRHFGCQVILLAQFLKAMPPIVRENVKKCFISKIQGSSTTREIIDTYRDSLSKRRCEDLIRLATKDYGFLVVDTTSQTNRVEDRFFRFKANINYPCKLIGSPKMYQLQALLDIIARCFQALAKVDAPLLQSNTNDIILR
jgi:hypothetical protein